MQAVASRCGKEDGPRVADYQLGVFPSTLGTISAPLNLNLFEETSSSFWLTQKEHLHRYQQPAMPCVPRTITCPNLAITECIAQMMAVVVMMRYPGIYVAASSAAIRA